WSRAPGSSNRWVAPGTIFNSFGQDIRQRRAVEVKDLAVLAADDQQRRRPDAAQVGAGEVRPAAARDDRPDRHGPMGGRDERRGGSGARAEESDRQTRRGLVLASPFGGREQ